MQAGCKLALYRRESSLRRKKVWLSAMLGEIVVALTLLPLSCKEEVQKSGRYGIYGLAEGLPADGAPGISNDW